MGQIRINKSNGMLYQEWDAIDGIELRETLNENEDCAVRAIASSTGCSYREAHDYCKRYFKRKHRDGAESFGKIMDERAGLSFPNNTKYKEFHVDKPMSVREFIEKNNLGIYMVVVKGHVFTIKNSIIIGNPEDREDLNVPVLFAYKIYKT